MDAVEAACRKATNGYRRGECDKTPLATLDVFAGCGGLSESLQRAGNLFYYNIFHKSRNIVYVSLVEGREGLWEVSGSSPYWYIYIYIYIYICCGSIS